jgi:hypothetical protein
MLQSEYVFDLAAGVMYIECARTLLQYCKREGYVPPRPLLLQASRVRRTDYPLSLLVLALFHALQFGGSLEIV